MLCPQSTYTVYKEYHSVCPLVGIGTLPTLLSPASVPLPQNRGGGGGGHTRLRMRGWGSSNSGDWRKSLTLCLLLGCTSQHLSLVKSHLLNRKSKVVFFLFNKIMFIAICLRPLINSLVHIKICTNVHVRRRIIRTIDEGTLKTPIPKCRL
jgi:hypothetical protein